jgi:putative transferase (TIGR04331 family)
VTESPLLVTTALEETWGSDDHIVFLGEWCRLYDRRHVWSARQHEVVSNHWDDRQKLKRDQDNLSELHDALLDELTVILNRYHRLERSRRYWQMLLDPWLLTYVAVMFDRWERLRTAFDRHASLETIALPHARDDTPPLDYDHFVQTAARSHVWNHALFVRIVEAAYSTRCVVRGSEASTESPHSTADSGVAYVLRTANAPSLAFKAAVAVDALLGKLIRANKITLYQSYFPFKALVSINRALRQIPRLYLDDFRARASVPTESDRDLSALALASKGRTDFEKFLFHRLPRDLPIACVEALSGLLERARRIRISTRAIGSANAHWGNELFKVWSAEQMSRGVKIVAMDHGGGIPPLFDTMSFEEKISDVRTVWTIPYGPNHVRLPPNKLVTRKFDSTKEYCSVIGNEMPLYPYRATAAPIAEQSLVGFHQVCDLYAAVDDTVQRAFRVKPYPDLGWNTRQRFRDSLGADRVYDETNYYRVLGQSRVVVCTYPNTTFSEAIATGLPTILLYPAHLWETIPEMDPLLEILRNARIVFHEPGPAAERLNEIWRDPVAAWAEPKTARARTSVLEYCLDLNEDWLTKWVAFLKRVGAQSPSSLPLTRTP